MPYRIEFFGGLEAPTRRDDAPHAPLEFSSRRSAVTYAEHHAPTDAEGFNIYRDDTLVRTIHLPRGAASTGG
jgi:hypothetical protein